MLMPLAACVFVIATAQPGTPPPQTSPPTVSGTKATAGPRQKPATVPEGASKAPSVDEKPNPGPAVRPRNVSVDVTISDQSGSADPVKKIVTMLVADGQTGNVRTRGTVKAAGTSPEGGTNSREQPVSLNVDASPSVYRDGSVKLGLSIEYQPSPSDGAVVLVTERVSVTLDSGKPLVISRAVDPSGDRKVTVEVTATVLK